MSNDNTVTRVGAVDLGSGAPADGSHVSVRVVGGVVRADFGGHANLDQATPEQHTSERPDAGAVTKHVEGQGTVTSPGIVRANSTELGRITGGNGASILSTARSNGGEPTGNLNQRGVTVCLAPGDERTRTSIQAAVSMGYLQQTPNGYQEVSAVAPQQAPAEAPKKTFAEHNEAQAQQQPQSESDFSAQGNMTMDLLNNTFGSSTVAEAVASAMVNGRVDIRAISEIGGVSEDEAREFVELAQGTIGMEMFQAMKATGISDADHNDAVRWMQANRPAQYKTAAVELAHGRKTGLMKALAGEFLNSILPSETALKAAGVETWTEGKTVYARLPDGTTGTLAALTRMGKL